MEPRTALELLGAALAVLLVLHLVARSVNRSRAKLSAPPPDQGKARAAPTEEVAKPAIAAPAVAAPAVAAPVIPAALPAIAAPAANKTVAAAPTKIKARSTAPSKRVVRAKSTPLAKPKRRPKRPAVAADQRVSRPAFLPVTKAKPAVHRGPKRAAPIRRRKKMPHISVMRPKAPVQDSPYAP